MSSLRDFSCSSSQEVEREAKKQKKIGEDGTYSGAFQIYRNVDANTFKRKVREVKAKFSQSFSGNTP